MAATAGKFEQIGGRLTYLPPFVNERFDGPPYWACTFTALLNGANVAWMGQKPATHAEVAALAGASGDSDTRGGSRSSHMVKAIRNRYKKNVRIESNVTAKQAQQRLASGWALVAAVTYGELPEHHRRWSPRFKRGHRVTLVGLSGDRTRILDPMASRGLDWGGEWITWAQFAKAWWPREQLWFKEGQYVNPAAKPVPPGGGVAPIGAGAPTTAATVATGRILRRFVPARSFRIAANSPVLAYDAADMRTPAKKKRFDHPSAANFDAVVAFERDATIDTLDRTFLQATNGVFAGLYLPRSTPGLTADIEPDVAGAAAAATAAEVAPTAPTIATVELSPDSVALATLEGRRLEWDRIARETAGLVLPPRP